MTGMDRAVRVLIIEDSSLDAGLIVRILRRDGLDVETLVAAGEEAVRGSLPAFDPDVILADLAIPGFSGAAAVAIAREWNPIVPCILVSGALAEDLLAQALRIGATDYVPKARLDALAPAVRRALAEGDERRARAKLEAELAESQALLAALMEHVPDHVYFKDLDSRFTMISRSMARSFGLDDPAEAIGRTDFDFFPEEHARPAFEDELEVMRTGRPLIDKAERETWPDGREAWASTTKLRHTDVHGTTRPKTGRSTPGTPPRSRFLVGPGTSLVAGQLPRSRGTRSTRMARRFRPLPTRGGSRSTRASPPRV